MQGYEEKMNEAYTTKENILSLYKPIKVHQTILKKISKNWCTAINLNIHKSNHIKLFQRVAQSQREINTKKF